MKIIILSIATLVVFTIVSCKTSKEVTPATNPKSVNELIVPAGFTWENSRNVTFTVTINDTKFPASISKISIFDADPATGGNVLTKGSATNKSAFTSKLYLSNNVTQVYIVKTAPDNSKITQQVQVDNININTAIGK